MSFDGINGFNFNGMGESAENILAAAQRTGGKHQLIRNEPKAVTMLASAGFSVIYRQTNDDPQANPLARDPAAFGNELVTNAPDAAYYHATNEIEGDDVHRWTGELLKWANDHPRKPKFVIYNYGTNKDAAVWEAAKPNIELAARTGHAIGVHLYDDGDHLDGAYHWLPIKRSLGGLWMFTEIAYIKSIFSPYDGWMGNIDEAHYIAMMELHSKVAQRENMPACWFSYDEWPIGGAHPFMLKGSARLIGELALLNVQHKWREDDKPPVLPPVTPPPTKPPGCLPVAWVVRKIKSPRGAWFRKQASIDADKWFLIAAGVILSVDYNPDGDVAEDDHVWRQYRIEEKIGYIRDDAADFVVEPAPDGVVVLTQSDVTAIVEHLQGIMNVLTMAAARLEKAA